MNSPVAAAVPSNVQVQGLVRQPSEPEQQRFLELLQKARAYYSTHADEAKKLAGKSKSSASESERAAWVATARMILNLDEFITRE